MSSVERGATVQRVDAGGQAVVHGAAMVLVVFVVALGSVVPVLRSWVPDDVDPGPVEVHRDGDFVVYDAKATGASAPSVRDDGYATYGNVTMRDSYRIRLVESDRVESVRPHVDDVAAFMDEVVGHRVTVADGTVPPGTRAAAGAIDVRVSTASPCSGRWLGCAAPTVEDGVVESAQVWIHPRLVDRSAAALVNGVRHELGHAFGLAHYDERWDGGIQVMHSTSFEADDFRSGDRNGLRALAGRATSAAPPPPGQPMVLAPAPPAPGPDPAPAPVAAVDPTGSVDDIVSTGFGIVVRGRAVDPDTTDAIGVLITMDDAPFELLASRSDEATGDRHGFEVVWAVDPGPHRVCVTARNIGPGTDVPLGCRDVVVTPTSIGQLGVQTL